MDNPKGKQKKNDDNLLAALCHFSILLGIVIGPMVIFVPLVMWLIEKDTSKFIAFHAKQCFFYQLSVLVILTGMSITAGILMFILVGFFLIPVIVFTGMAALVYGVIGGVLVLQGKDFKYFYIGDKLSN